MTGFDTSVRVQEDWIAATREALGADAALLDRLLTAIPAGYDELTAPSVAVTDVRSIIGLIEGATDLATAVFRAGEAETSDHRVRVYRQGPPIPIADLVPLFDHLGLRAVDEHSFGFVLVEGGVVHLHDVGVQLPDGIVLDDALEAELRAVVESQLRGETEIDGFNRLVLAAGLTGRQVEVVRAYARYLRQSGFPLSQQFVEGAVARHASITRGIVALFEQHFDPARVHADAAEQAAAVARVHAEVAAALDAVPSLDDDRALSALQALVEATLRTNVYRPGDDGAAHRPVMAFKLDPAKVPDLPLPRPMYEIWVCSPRVEGVHLRGGAVARGGIRWSDRRDDFRTEVLGLVKAQMVKNSVIVPTGAKGGFVPKRSMPTPEATRAEGVACYREYVAGLLDLTDNYVGTTVVPPPHTVRRDGDDPYLVVAADKGTATFSDIANGIAIEYGFWLGDAFASGGSAGYDHKAMGITARGAWESVRRHARSLGRDADRDQLTVVGIGDMSGDVFGNGLLQSRHVKLVAAFDHRHVFIDPDPDPETSFLERERLFALPRSSWADYDASLLSAGGGIHPRAAKSIELSPEAQLVLGVERATFAPHELISAILRAPVDLLWNGGIGTYVKASTETHAEVGDRANDPLRVNGAELRCAMVAEGGNLGFTQRGRVEYALNGGLVNTDAIDNSAGVDCSDHEVNIKILLGDVMASTGMSLPERDTLLESMTDEVAEMVLADNTAQTLTLAIARQQAAGMANVHARYLNALEADGWINRALEFLPTDKQIAERQTAGAGLTMPEFAVLLAYTKNSNIDLITASNLPDDPYLERELVAYFPTPLREHYGEQIRRHRLRREIIATSVGNQMANISGISFDHRITEDTGADIVEIARAWMAARDILDAGDLWERIEDLTRSTEFAGVVPEVQLELFFEARRMLERGVLWLLRHRRPPIDLAPTVERFRVPMAQLAHGFDELLSGRLRDQVFAVEAGRLAAGVPERLAQASATWPLVHTGFDIVELALAEGAEVRDVARTYWHVFDELQVGWIWEAVGALPRHDRWQTQARYALRDDLLAVLADLTADARRAGSVAAWRAGNEAAVARTNQMFTEIRRAERFDLTVLAVALRQLRNLTITTHRHP